MRSISPVGRRGWQDEQRDDLPLSEVVYVLWGRRLLVIGPVLLLVAVVLFFALFKEPVYTAEAVVNIEPREELTSTEERDAFMDDVMGDVVTGMLRGVMRQAGWEAGVEQLNDERLAGGALAADASVERRAEPPEGAGLRLLVYGGVAAAVGLLVGGVGAMLLEGRARSWRDARDAELTLRAPVLGIIPDYSSTEGG